MLVTWLSSLTPKVLYLRSVNQKLIRVSPSQTRWSFNCNMMLNIKYGCCVCFLHVLSAILVVGTATTGNSGKSDGNKLKMFFSSVEHTEYDTETWGGQSWIPKGSKRKRNDGQSDASFICHLPGVCRCSWYPGNHICMFRFFVGVWAWLSNSEMWIFLIWEVTQAPDTV